MLEHFRLIRNVGQFGGTSPSAATTLTPFSLIYGENGRGKTTLAAILRSLATNNPKTVMDRQTLGAQNEPHIVVQESNRSIVFQNGAWQQNGLDIAIFDDEFVSDNVCSGIDLESSHRQNLHELILGRRGVELNATLQGYVAKIEEHNAQIRQKGDAIPANARGPLSVNAFCDLQYDPEIDAKLESAEQRVAAAKSADTIRQRRVFQTISLPDFNIEEIDAILNEGLAELETHAVEKVKDHLSKLGSGGERWVADGMTRIDCLSDGQDHKRCPFCAQDINASSLVHAYKSYFSDAYKTLAEKIRHTVQQIQTEHGGDVRAAFEREVRKAVETHEFWREFANLPTIDIDTGAISREWAAAQQAVLQKLNSKALAPLETLSLDNNERELIHRYRQRIQEVSNLSSELAASNEALQLVKEQAGEDDLSTLNSDLEALRARKKRFQPDISALCEKYLEEKESKRETEKKRNEARSALDQYREQIFPAYQNAINEYLSRLNANFRIGKVESVNTRGGSSASYCIIINKQEVDIRANDGPNFRNTLSAGDRATLALAFFFASLDQDPNLANKIVAIDDPMTSLDEHRTVATRQQIRAFAKKVTQSIILSHSKSFLCELWEHADKNVRSACRISRAQNGSQIIEWNVRDDCLTEHDKRHERVSRYLQLADPNEERQVAEALRPILESFMRVAYPEHFPPGAMLGQFVDTCRRQLGTQDQILSEADVEELKALLEYSNKFHHDTNRAYETVAINDTELADFARRTLLFSSRG